MGKNISLLEFFLASNFNDQNTSGDRFFLRARACVGACVGACVCVCVCLACTGVGTDLWQSVLCPVGGAVGIDFHPIQIVLLFMLHFLIFQHLGILTQSSSP